MQTSMMTLTIGKLSIQDLRALVCLDEKPIAQYAWTQVETVPISPLEQQQVEIIQARLAENPVHLLNEATLWSRGIYPLLVLAEQKNVQAWSEVAITAHFQQFNVSGIADGVLGKTVAGRLETPYLIVLEAKRAIDAVDPIPQLYGQLLAAAHLNWVNDRQDPQEIFGCYTIGDNWTFIKGCISDLEATKPNFVVEYAKELSEKYDAIAILKILKSITAQP